MPDATTLPVTYHANRLSLVFQELLTAIVRIRARRQQVPNADAFRARSLELLRQAEEDARRRGYSGDDASLGVFAVVAFLDESVLHSADPIFRDWARRPIQEEMFKGHVAGEKFFQNIRGLLTADDSPRTADLLEVYQLCLLLGYRGRYGPGREGELRAIADRISEKIRRVRGVSAALAPAALPREEAVPRDADPWARRLAVAAIALTLLLLSALLIYRLSLSQAMSGLDALYLPLRGA